MSSRPLTDALRETLAVFTEHPAGTPLTTNEVATHLDCGRRSTYDKLDGLVEKGYLETKAVGARGRVWWRPTGLRSGQSDAAGGVQTQDVSFRSLVAAVEEYAIFLLSPSGQVVSWNRGAKRIKGYEREDILGEPLDVFYTDNDVAAGVPERNLAAAVRRGSVEDEGWRVRKDGSRFWAFVTITALFDDAGELQGYTKVTKDTTERRECEKRLRQQRDTLETEIDDVFERVEDAFVGLDEDWRVTYANDRAIELLGLAAEDVFGRVVWETVPETAIERLRRLAERSMGRQEAIEFEHYSERLATWLEVRAFPSDSGLSVYLRDVTARKEREYELQRYEQIVETVTDGIYVVDDDGYFTMVNGAYTELTGHTADELLGKHVSRVVDEETIRQAREYEAEMVDGERDTARFESDILTADGEKVPMEASFTLLSNDGGATERVGVVRDVTERVRRERDLERQRERLSTLDDLNAVARDVTDSVIERDSRIEIERTLCDHLTAADTYDFAWVGEIDPASRMLVHRIDSGRADEFEALLVTTDPDEQRSEGAIGRAIRSRTIQITSDVPTVAPPDGRQEHARVDDIESMAAIPIVHGEALYGVLNVYTAREDAFSTAERDVIAGIGEVVGHAIAAVERKRALMSDELVELEFRLTDAVAALDVDGTGDGLIELTETVPIAEEGTYLLYGTADPAGIDLVADLVSALAHWEDFEVGDEFDEEIRFRVRLSDPPVLATVAGLGGHVETFAVEDGDMDLVVHLVPGSDVRHVIDVVTEHYPAAEMVSRRQISRLTDSNAHRQRVVFDRLTDRQRHVLVAAYSSGFFEQPRPNSGARLADALGISTATFHRHLRAATRELVASLLDAP